jgi:hypothetical protein
MVISYHRISRTGFDVAVFTHEDLSESGGRQPGTGGKYLERAMQKYYGSAERMLARHVQAVLKRYRIVIV